VLLIESSKLVVCCHNTDHFLPRPKLAEVEEFQHVNTMLRYVHRVQNQSLDPVGGVAQWSAAFGT